MNQYEIVCESLRRQPRQWLVTGVAGFIGSNLLEALLRLDQRVMGLDNFATGKRSNLDEVRRNVGPLWSNFRFIEGDITQPEACRAACDGVDYVLHQAALGSVPRSIADPVTSTCVNVMGFLHMIVAARDARVRRFVYAASSSTYGDSPELPKVEERIGNALSPYGVTKLVDELYAGVFARCYGMRSTGLRYFNVFGPRQDPAGAYAAVIPRWIAALIRGDRVNIHGDGSTSRDFCFVQNVVQANLLAALAGNEGHAIYNIAVGQQTSLSVLHLLLFRLLKGREPQGERELPVFGEPRAGDVRHSLASVDKANRELGYNPTHTLEQGLRVALPWYLEQDKKSP